VVDFDYEVDRVSSNIECLIEQNSDLKCDIICLEEQNKTEKLQGKILDSQIAQKQYDIQEYNKRVEGLNTHINAQTEQGDNVYAMLR